MIKDPHWPRVLGYKPIALGLERIKTLMEVLGDPHRRLPPVVHVAGTNGKGSTIAFIRAIVEAAGYKAHVYTSPHLVEFNERIVVASEKISDGFLYENLEECRKASQGIPITFFEGTTGAALLAFSKVRADILLLETGMGGRLDATNIISKPAVTIITQTSKDHMEYLGNSLEKIAEEKAGIIKPGVPCVSSPQHPEVMKILESYTSRKKSPLVIAPEKTDYELSLPGKFQQVNAATALEAVKILKFLNINEENIRTGFKNAVWPARLQRLDKGKLVDSLPGNAELWVDGGHNIAAANVINEYIGKWNDAETYMIFGMMDNRDIKEFLAIVAKNIHRLLAIEIPGEEKCHKIADILSAAESVGIRAQSAESITSALKKIAESSYNRKRILVCGSLYLAGTVLAENG